MVRAVFIHLPKTAGTSFRDALCQGFGAEAVSPPFAASYLSDDDVRALRQYEVVSGHISIDDVNKYFPEATLFTMLREPVDRCISFYYYARKQPPMPFPDVTAAQTHTLDDFFALDPQITYRNIYNRQVRQLGGHVLNTDTDMDVACTEALRTLNRCAWVGRQENLDDDMIKLGSIFPEMEGIALPRLNVTSSRLPAGHIDVLLRAKIGRYNRYDLALYNAYIASLKTFGSEAP